MAKGTELASATVPWHWLFFCLASKLCYENYDILNYLSKKLRGLEVALVDFSLDRRPCVYYHPSNDRSNHRSNHDGYYDHYYDSYYDQRWLPS